jgi:hypothetical protein
MGCQEEQEEEVNAHLALAPRHGSVLHPRHSEWSQWHASAVTFFESWQIWLQYFCLSGAIQLQAGCAHFFGPDIAASSPSGICRAKRDCDSADVVMSLPVIGFPVSLRGSTQSIRPWLGRAYLKNPYRGPNSAYRAPPLRKLGFVGSKRPSG